MKQNPLQFYYKNNSLRKNTQCLGGYKTLDHFIPTNNQLKFFIALIVDKNCLGGREEKNKEE